MRCSLVLSRISRASLTLLLVAGAPVGVARSVDAAGRAGQELRGMAGFGEPLRPSGPTDAADDAALLAAVKAYQGGGRTDATAPLEAFLKAHPASPWRVAVQVNLGLIYRHTGYFSRALAIWGEAWEAGKGLQGEVAPLVDRAGAELAELNARLGRVPRLEALLKELDARPLRGSASEKVRGAHESLWAMERTPERNFRCGPLSLASIRNSQGKPEPRLYEEPCTPQGTSLQHNWELAGKYGMDLQMARRAPGSEVVVPALVHWKAGHFAAIVREDRGRYLVQDPTFTDEIWVSKAALDEEATGYQLVRGGALPQGWSAVGAAEAGGVWGRGGAPFANTKHKGPRKGGCGSSNGMARYSYHTAIVSLFLDDTPVGYRPALGPSAFFHLAYVQRESSQPQAFTFANLGPKWSFDFLAYLVDDPTIAVDTPTFSMGVARHGGGEDELDYSFLGARGADVAASTPTGPSQVHRQDHSYLVRTDLTSYKRYLPDGSVEVYEHTDGARTYPRRIFMTKILDPQGNALSLQYDGQNRVVAVVDAQGKTTTLSYELASDPLKLTKVTDPFGRSATFGYNAAGQLARITDVLGLSSEFTYGPWEEDPTAPADFVNALITPYGTHRFKEGANFDARWLETIDPMGARERVEYRIHPGDVGADDSQRPEGFAGKYPSATFFWDKRAYALHSGDYTHAQATRWLLSDDGEGSIGIPHSERGAESTGRWETWFAYPGQSSTSMQGSLEAPSRVVRANADGSFSEWRNEYNALGRVVKSTDPLGRETSFVYADNQIDLLEIRQTSHGRNDLLATYAYNDRHQPVRATDAAGQATVLTYNAQGQVTSVTDPAGRTTTFTYGADSRLSAVTGPTGTTSFTYDAVGRMKTVTSPEGDTLSTDYDVFDRPVLVTYPDGKTEQFIYDRLDLKYKQDRGGRWTAYTYNALRQLVEVQDALGRVTRLDWCGCGSLDGLVDPLGQVTTWLRDLDGRVLAKRLADGSQTTFQYDAGGRLIRRTDARGQATRYVYGPDGALAQVSYENARRSTAPVSYTYDADYARVATMTDGIGTTTYAYNPVAQPPALGAGRLASVSGPLPNSTLAYTYDALGRVVQRSLSGSSSTVAYDTLGRVQQVTNFLGQFTYGYEGNTGRLASVQLPNGMQSTYTYDGLAGARRLKEIHHQKQDGGTVSKFAYTYDADGQIQTWTRQADAQLPTTYEFRYDAVGQLLDASMKGTNGDLLREFHYGYDAAGNRTSEVVDGQAATAAYNGVNQLTGMRSSSVSASLARPGAKAKAKPHAKKPASR